MPDDVIEPEYLPRPIPTMINVMTAESDAYRGVVMEVRTATGIDVFFLSPDVAEQVGGFLIENARMAKGPQLATPLSPEVIKHIEKNRHS